MCLLDVNECTSARPPCSGIAQCVNTAGSFECSCPAGYKLAADHRTCQGQWRHVPSWFLLKHIPLCSSVSLQILAREWRHLRCRQSHRVERYKPMISWIHDVPKHCHVVVVMVSLKLRDNAKIHYTSFPVTSPQHKRQVRNKSVTSCSRQKSVVSVVSCRFPNSITTTCWQQVGDKLATCHQLVANLRGSVARLRVSLRGSYGDFGLFFFFLLANS